MTKKSQIIIASAIVVLVVSITITAIVMSKKVRIKNKNPKRILFVGDSQTAIISPSGNPIFYTYPNLVKEKLKDKGIFIDVIALQGKQISWMKDELKKKLQSNKYDRVYIYGGGNDVVSGISNDVVIKNIQDMVDLSIKNGADAFVNLGYRIDNFSDINKMPLSQYVTKKEDWIPLIKRRKKLQDLLPKSINNANFVPIYDLNGLTSDGIHPNANGHRIVAQKIIDTI